VGRCELLQLGHPALGISARKCFQGIATLTGGKPITEGPDIQLNNIQISGLGQAAKITIDKNSTVVEVKVAYDRRIRMPLYANLCVPPGDWNNAALTAHRELAQPEQRKHGGVQEYEHF
jgi:hypothetical protein